MCNEWIGVDLDGTLALYDGWYDEYHIGEPIPLMLERVNKWIAEGIEVKIFTARVTSNNPNKQAACSVIKKWCEKHIGVPLDVTAEKDFFMMELWDDRCISVETNSGLIKSAECLENEVDY